MPTLTRVYLKTALIYLVAAFSLSVLLALQKTQIVSGIDMALTPTFFHVLIVGWITQLIFGVVYWMFPKYSRERPRGYESLSWGAYILLNLGLLLRIVAEPMLSVQPVASLWGSALFVSAVLQWLAGMAFVLNTWPRVKER